MHLVITQDEQRMHFVAEDAAIPIKDKAYYHLGDCNVTETILTTT